MVLLQKESELDEKIFAVLVIYTACDFYMKVVGSFLKAVQKLAIWTAQNGTLAAVLPQ